LKRAGWTKGQGKPPKVVSVGKIYYCKKRWDRPSSGHSKHSEYRVLIAEFNDEVCIKKVYDDGTAKIVVKQTETIAIGPSYGKQTVKDVDFIVNIMDIQEHCF